MLTSFKIQNFRSFRHLQIDRFGHINLIVGKNNVGKSSLLEALWLYASSGALPVIAEILLARNEMSRSSDANSDSGDRLRLDFEHLFYGRSRSDKGREPIKIGPIDSSEDTLSIALEWYAEAFDENGQLPPIDDDTVKYLQPTALAISMGSQYKRKLPVQNSFPFFNRRWMRSEASAGKEINCLYMPAAGLKKPDVGYLWDNIALTDLEQDLLSALRIIAPEVERLSLVGDPMHDRGRIAVIKIAGQTRPIPLSSMGDGLNRIFGIMLVLANAKDGILLVDEIENGIHYTVQPNLWSLVFNVAHRLNVQVFATTHSLDCITAFEKVAAQQKEKNGTLIRLEAKREMTNAVLFDESELSIVSRDQIEVR